MTAPPLSKAGGAALLLAFALCGCSGPANEYRCISGLLHIKFGPNTWVQTDGHNYIGWQPGVMHCAEPQATEDRP